MSKPVFAPVFETYPLKGEPMRQLCVGADLEEAEATAKKIGEECIRKGGRTVWADGRTQFIRVEAIFGLTPHADGSEVHDYQWHADGNRVRCTRKLITVRDGRVTEEELLGHSWRLFENV